MNVQAAGWTPVGRKHDASARIHRLSLINCAREQADAAIDHFNPPRNVQQHQLCALLWTDGEEGRGEVKVTQQLCHNTCLGVTQALVQLCPPAHLG